jgi:hypothetical protein
MKKRLFSIALALMLVVSLSSVSASATDQGTRAACSHSSTKTVVTYTYQGTTATTHIVYATTTVTCTSCKTVLSTTRSQKSVESHTFPSGEGSYQSSVHSGAAATHYAIYSRTCTICKSSYTHNVKLGCTSSGCNYVQSVPTDVA